jgi:flagellar biosynthesis/type III secretory pathway chaperone
MKTTLDVLVHALREELQHYGELLARLDEEQECVLRRAPDDLLSAVVAIQEQSDAVQRARSYREDCRKQLVTELGLPLNSNFSQLVQILPRDYRPLISALMDENNALLRRVQQRARQNHLLLARSLELMQSFLGTMFQVGHGSTYDQTGGSNRLNTTSHALYEAVG